MDAELQRAIGRLEGKLDAVASTQSSSQASIMTRLDKMDERLRSVEIKSAAYGAGGGGVVAIAITVLIEFLKSKAGIP